MLYFTSLLLDRIHARAPLTDLIYPPNSITANKANKAKAPGMKPSTHEYVSFNANSYQQCSPSSAAASRSRTSWTCASPPQECLDAPMASSSTKPRTSTTLRAGPSTSSSPAWAACSRALRLRSGRVAHGHRALRQRHREGGAWILP